MKITDWFKKRDVLTPQERGEVFTEIGEKRRCIQVLLANKNPDMKRKLGVYGKYVQYRDDAAKAIVDDTFYLSIILILLRKDKRMSARFGDAVAEVNAYATATIGPDGKIVQPEQSKIGVLTPADDSVEIKGEPLQPGGK
jgi:hypothetical protein